MSYGARLCRYFAIAACLIMLEVGCGTRTIETKNYLAATQTTVRSAMESETARAVGTQIDAPLPVTAANGEPSHGATMTASASTRLAIETATTAPRPPPTAINVPPAAAAVPDATPTLLLVSSENGAPSSILAFSAVPTTTVKLGEVITATWQARVPGELCPFVNSPEGPLEKNDACVKVPAAGSHTFAVQENDLDWGGLLLRVRIGQVIQRALVPIVLGCQGLHDWFMPSPPPQCPERDAQVGDAYSQRFEHGWVLWTRAPNRLYVFYETDVRDGEFEFLVNDDNYTPDISAGAQDILTPPAGLFAPAGTFGEIWRGDKTFAPRARDRLGWAAAPISKYESAYQCIRPRSGYSKLWTCFLRAPDGKIWQLRPDSTAQVHFVWSER